MYKYLNIFTYIYIHTQIHTYIYKIKCVFQQCGKSTTLQSVTYGWFLDNDEVENVQMVWGCGLETYVKDGLPNLESTSLPARTQRLHRRSLLQRKHQLQLLLLVCVQRSQTGHAIVQPLEFGKHKLKRFYLAVWVFEMCQLQWIYPLKLEFCSVAILSFHPTINLKQTTGLDINNYTL